MRPQRKHEFAVSDVIERWAKNYPKVITWLSRLQQPNTRAWNLWFFCKTVGKDPDELLALKDDRNSTEVEVILDNFVANENVKLSLRVNSAIAVRSFFKHNYRDLAKVSGAISYIKQKPYRRHTKEELLKIYRATQNPRDRALVTFLWSTGIAKESITKIQWKHLEQDWEKQQIPHIGLPDVLVKGHGIGKWKGVEQHTFLTPEAKRDLTEYVAWLERIKCVKMTLEDHIFVEVHPPYKELNYGSLGAFAVRLSKRSGVPFGLHDARRYLETALEETKINPNWARKIRGRKVRGEEAPYSRPAIEQLRNAFKEAVPLLQFTQPTELMELKRRQEIVEEIQSKILAGEPLTEEDRQNVGHYGIRLTKRRQLTKKEIEDNCADGEHCLHFEQIPESKLLGYLKEGWVMVHRLENGEVIIKKQEN